MLHQLLNVAYVLGAENVHAEAMIAERDPDQAVAAWEAELHRPFSTPGRTRATGSRIGPGVAQFMPLPPPPVAA